MIHNVGIGDHESVSVLPLAFRVLNWESGACFRVWSTWSTISFFIIFDDVVEYLSIRCAQLKKQGRRTEPILTVG